MIHSLQFAYIQTYVKQLGSVSINLNVVVKNITAVAAVAFV